ncbi:MAG: dynamin family protein [Verrucomicrobiaceae bacterium]|nr:dynamin family protein [Verrucomicrobiaceae bacterium]
MIGEEYFDLRSRLGTDLYTLASLVRETGGSEEDIQILDNLIASLNDPFVFVVVGEVNVGKSTFLNALFGADISKTGVMPTTDKICFFKYGTTVQRMAISPTLDEYRVPCDFLKDFHIVDTPGTNSIENEHQQITERFVPLADLVIFVFSAMNPWGASAWHFLDKVHRQWQKNILFVLQQSDVRSSEELGVIRDYMRQLCVQRFQREFPIFSVSGKMAFMARSSGIDRERLMAESGFQSLEAHITEVVMQSPARRTKLQASLRLASHILAQIQEKTHDAIALEQKRTDVVNQLETERTLQMARTLAKFDAALDATDRDFRDAGQRIVTTMAERFTLGQTFRSLKKDQRVLPNLDHKLNQDLLSSSSERWKNIAVTLDDDVQRFGAFVAKQWLGELYLAPKTDLPPDDPVHAHRRFQAKIESALRRLVIGIRMNEVLEPAAELSLRSARRIPWLAAIVGTITALLLIFFGPVAGGSALALSVLWVGVELLRLRAALRRAIGDLSGLFESARPLLRTMIKDQISEETTSAFAPYAKVLERPAEQEVDLHGRASQLKVLQESLHSVGEALRTQLAAPPR